MRYDLEYILARVKISPKTGCWLWQRSTSDGYGQFVIQGTGKSFRAHRYAYELVYGKLPATVLVRHYECKNRRCCNPAHMRPGSVKDNYWDSRRKHMRSVRAMRGKPAHNRMPIEINGRMYKSQVHAMRGLGISRSEVLLIGRVVQ